MRISFCKMPYLLLFKDNFWGGTCLSILFYEDFFLQVSTSQRLLLVQECEGCFQSSFMRISFCKVREVFDDLMSEISKHPFNPLLWGFLFARHNISCSLWATLSQTFNPLLWGFLFARTRGKCPKCGRQLVKFSFQSSFMRISFCKVFHLCLSRFWLS